MANDGTPPLLIGNENKFHDDEQAVMTLGVLNGIMGGRFKIGGWL